ncbi:MAG: hypothetical protein KAX49_03750 [Halanaerobiales bacterium]|nr:hypothetical protein [Halanaerobiales bacterium]
MFEKEDNIFIKKINSNILRANKAIGLSKIEYLNKVIKASVFLSIALYIRKDYTHSIEYINTAENAGNEIIIIIKQMKERVLKEKKDKR